MILDYKYRTQLHHVRISFNTPTFDIIEKVNMTMTFKKWNVNQYSNIKDERASFEDLLSSVGGTMGLFTGFSLISGVEMIYFLTKLIYMLMQKIFIKQSKSKYR